MPKLVTTEEWVARARDRHGDKYSYPTDTWGDYNSTTKVTIVCPAHGGFMSSLSNHTHITNPTGCPVCSNKITKSRDQRIAQAVAQHGDKYDYSLWPNITKANTLVKTLCKACDKIWTHNVDNHVRGRGCPNCIKRIAANNKKSARRKVNENKIALSDKYIKMALDAHSNKYDYSLIPNVFRVKALQPIICPDHGVFYSVFYNHAVRGSECPQCSNEKMKNYHMFGFDKWSIILRKKHPELTFRCHEDGSDTAKSRVYARCKVHGEWLTTIDCLKVSSCPSCAGASQTFLYINNVEGMCVKYGIANDADVRLANQNKKNKLMMNRILLFKFEESSSCRACETEIKRTVKPVLSRIDLIDGWSETASFNEIDFILEKVKEFGGSRYEL